MPFAKPSVFRGSFRLLRGSRPSTTTSQAWRQIGQRCYASHGHGATKASGDLPWAIGAVAFTVPATWYLIRSDPRAKSAHGDHSSHGNENSKNHEAEETEDESEDKGVEKSSESDSDADEDTDTLVTSDDEGSDNDESGYQEKLSEATPDPSEGDKAASKPAGSQNAQPGKPESLSDTDTKRSIDIAENPEKSKKSESAPDSAKLKGTVDPKRT